jgi:hypothetical protein
MSEPDYESFKRVALNIATSADFYASVKNFEFLFVWNMDLNSFFASDGFC